MKITKTSLSGLLIVSLVLTAGGCVQTNIDANDAKNELECRFVEGDYSWLGTKCCLDDDHNDKCDFDEVSSKGRCDNECSQPICKGDNRRVFNECVKKEDGC